MNLAIVSHKECWRDPNSPSGYSTVGGFPYQIEAFTDLFDRVTLIIALRDSPPPSGIIPYKVNIWLCSRSMSRKERTFGASYLY